MLLKTRLYATLELFTECACWILSQQLLLASTHHTYYDDLEGICFYCKRSAFNLFIRFNGLLLKLDWNAFYLYKDMDLNIPLLMDWNALNERLSSHYYQRGF